VTQPAKRSWPKPVFRIAAFVVPSALAWCEAFTDPHPSDLTDAVTHALGPLWVLLAGALLLRAISAAARKRRDPSISILAQLDVLTAGGSALAWLSAASIVLALWLGWASLAAVGLLGSALFHIVVVLAFVAMRGADPVRGASIARTFAPEVLTEGDEVIEELRFLGVRIPIGFRLFVEGRVGPRWAVSRHVLDASEAGGEVVLESDVGPAIRGEHDPEPLTVWLQDTFGICRSARVEVSAPRLTVLPRLRETEKASAPLDHGDGPRAPRPVFQLPTEGLFQLREYQQGDDVRRIHWVRSQAARELIVRLPDELPPDRPRVRLVLDTFFPEAFAFDCDAPSEMLDAMVGVWLAIGRTLAESGTRVTLVTTIPQGDGAYAKTRQELSRRAFGPALRLGAQITWQNRVLVDELLTEEATLVVSRAMLARPREGNVRWIAVVPGEHVTSPAWPLPSDAILPHPMGSADNRWSRSREEGNRIARLRTEHARALLVMHGVARPLPGSFLARLDEGRTVRLEALR
jgi:uncharacterized protein (DUF58 family)